MLSFCVGCSGVGTLHPSHKGSVDGIGEGRPFLVLIFQTPPTVGRCSKTSIVVKCFSAMRYLADQLYVLAFMSPISVNIFAHSRGDAKNNPHQVITFLFKSEIHCNGQRPRTRKIVAQINQLPTTEINLPQDRREPQNIPNSPNRRQPTRPSPNNTHPFYRTWLKSSC